MEKFKIRMVIMYFCKQGMPPKEIHEDFMDTLGKWSPFYYTVKKWVAEFKRRERALRMMDGLAALNRPLLIGARPAKRN